MTSAKIQSAVFDSTPMKMRAARAMTLAVTPMAWMHRSAMRSGGVYCGKTKLCTIGLPQDSFNHERFLECLPEDVAMVRRAFQRHARYAAGTALGIVQLNSRRPPSRTCRHTARPRR